jgi:cytochrome c oxidase assembly factor CtaG
MDLSDAIFRSWSVQLEPTLCLLATAFLYLKGWAKLRRLVPHRFGWLELLSFEGGLGLLFLALFSPLDTFSGLLLEVHMTQHLLLMMIVPPLLLLGQPFLPILTALPRPFTRKVLAPVLKSDLFRAVGSWITHPVFCWFVYVGVTLGWHLPAFYELALRSTAWHRLEHFCFLGGGLLFWWPVVQPWPSRPRWPRWSMIPYLLLADIQNTALSAFLTFYDRVLYPTYAQVPRLGNLDAAADQNIAGTIMWVPGSIIYLVPAGLIVLQVLSPRSNRPSPVQIPARPAAKAPPATFKRAPRLRWSLTVILRSPFFRRSVQICLLSLAIAIVVDGFVGPQVGPMNLAGVLPWVHWRGFTVLAILFAGNLFCMGCPFMLVRDLGRNIFPASHTWPRALRSKWIAVGLLAIYFWAYEAFHLWNSPWLTAWIIVAYFAAATLIDGWFKGASFCKYVCPIGQFHFVQSLTAPAEIKVREADVCRRCQTFDCLRGNESQRGCELQLFQPRKSGNLDCTFCLDCVKACPHTNVSLLPAIPGRDLWTNRIRSSIGRFENRADLAGLVLVLVFGAFASAAAMIIPMTSALDRLSLLSGVFSRPAILLIFFSCFIVLLPASAAVGCAFLSKKAGDLSQPFREVCCSFVMGLAPIGAAMWIAHNSFHLFTASHAFIPVLQRIAGSLKLTSMVTPNWNIQSWGLPEVLDFELLVLDAGFLLSLYALWQIGRRYSSDRQIRVFLPWALLSTFLFVIGVFILFQPMEMRGTVGQREGSDLHIQHSRWQNSILRSIRHLEC